MIMALKTNSSGPDGEKSVPDDHFWIILSPPNVSVIASALQVSSAAAMTAVQVLQWTYCYTVVW